MTTGVDLSIATRALVEADEAIQAYWSRPQSDCDSRTADLELACSANTRALGVVLSALYRQMTDR